MFKIGDKVVCIDNCYFLKKYTIYTIENVDSDGDINLVGFDWIFYGKPSFISLKEYRKQKLNKLCLNQEIN